MTKLVATSWHCPQCGQSHTLRIAARLSVSVDSSLRIREQDSEPTVLPDDFAQCLGCHWYGKAGDLFEVGIVRTTEGDWEVIKAEPLRDRTTEPEEES